MENPFPKVQTNSLLCAQETINEIHSIKVDIVQCGFSAMSNGVSTTDETLATVNSSFPIDASVCSAVVLEPRVASNPPTLCSCYQACSSTKPTDVHVSCERFVPQSFCRCVQWSLRPETQEPPYHHSIPMSTEQLNSHDALPGCNTWYSPCSFPRSSKQRTVYNRLEFCPPVPERFTFVQQDHQSYCSHLGNVTHELSRDLCAKEIELLERCYGGHLRSQRAARTIQNAYRMYRLRNEYARIRLGKGMNQERNGFLLQPLDADQFCNRSSKSDPYTSHSSAVRSESPEDLFLEKAYVDWAMKAATAQTACGIPSISDDSNAASCDGTLLDLVTSGSSSSTSHSVKMSEQSSIDCLTNSQVSSPLGHCTTNVTAFIFPRDLDPILGSGINHSPTRLATTSVDSTFSDEPCHVTISVVPRERSLGRVISADGSLRPLDCAKNAVQTVLSCELPRRRTYPSRESSSLTPVRVSPSKAEHSVDTSTTYVNQWHQSSFGPPYAASRSVYTQRSQRATEEPLLSVLSGSVAPVVSFPVQQPRFPCSCFHHPKSHALHTQVAGTSLCNRSCHPYPVSTSDRLSIPLGSTSTSNRTLPKSTSHCPAVFAKRQAHLSCQPVFVAVPSSLLGQCYLSDRTPAVLPQPNFSPSSVKPVKPNHLFLPTPCCVNYSPESLGAHCCSSSSHPHSITSVGPIQHATTQLSRQKFRAWEKRRKRFYRIGLNLFNKSPLKGIDFLIKWSFLDCAPENIARFLLTRKGLSRAAIGDYLGNTKDELAMTTTRQFMRQLDFAGLEVDEALRFLLSCFRTPGESQKIVHLLTEFQSAYVEQNADRVKDQFRNPDTVMVLAYAIVMLHTDMYSPSVRPQSKMTKEEFVRNLRGVDAGEDINCGTLSAIYDRIKQREMSVLPDHTDQVRKIQQHLTGPNRPINLAVAHRRLVCYCRLYEVPDRHKKERPGAHQREVFLFNDILLITKAVQRRRRDASIAYQVRMCLSLSGMRLSTFEAVHYPYGLEIATFLTGAGQPCSKESASVGSPSILAGAHARILVTMNTKTASDRVRFLEDLQECILEVAEMDRLRLEEERVKKMQHRKRHIKKDSGISEERFYNRSPDLTRNHLLSSLSSSSKTTFHCTTRLTDLPFLTHYQDSEIPIRTAATRDTHVRERGGMPLKASMSSVGAFGYQAAISHQVATCLPNVAEPEKRLRELTEQQRLSNDSGLPADLEPSVSHMLQAPRCSPCSSPIQT